MSLTGIHEFSGRIEKVGINPYVDIPLKVSQSFSRQGYIPVKGMLNEVSIQGTLVPVGGGRYRLYINTDMRKKAGVKVGDDIDLRIELDTEPRLAVIPEKLREALENNKEAKIAFERMSPSNQKEILAYLNYLKTPAALERNIKKVIKGLIK